MAAVACVIVNRASHPSWWGNSIEACCKAPNQFSCWLPNDANLKKLMDVTDEDDAFYTALIVASLAVLKQIPDLTNGADSYYAPSYFHYPPYWTKGETPTAIIGHHKFYKLRKGA